MADLYRLINHPEWMNQDTLFELRSHLARFPYDQTARLLFLQNLYLMHGSTFGEELRKAAFYVSDCTVLFQMIEGKNYIIEPHERPLEEEVHEQQGADRTIALIDNFLNTLPEDSEPKRQATAINPATDYVSYLLQLEDAEPLPTAFNKEQKRADDLIDSFIQTSEEFGITLPENPEPVAQAPINESSSDEGCLTETLARIYIKQGRYSKALEIIKRLSLKNPKKSAYFADQMRFLEKLVLNAQLNC